MRELIKNEFSRITQLLNEEKVHCTFAYAVVDGRQPGQVYVDNQINPTFLSTTLKPYGIVMEGTKTPKV